MRIPRRSVAQHLLRSLRLAPFIPVVSVAVPVVSIGADFSSNADAPPKADSSH